MWRQSDALCPAGSRQARSLTLQCGGQGQVLSRAAQSQESNVPPGYGVGWRPPPGLGESVGIRNGLSWSEAGGLETCLRPWVMHHQHSRDARNDCVKIAPGWAQVSGPVDRVAAFPYRLKVTHG